MTHTQHPALSSHLMMFLQCVEGGNAGPLGFATQCAGAEETGTAVMCPGYTGSPLICEDRDTGETVLAGLQSYTWACGPQVRSNIMMVRQTEMIIAGSAECLH